jgi:hypothetical protein
MSERPAAVAILEDRGVRRFVLEERIRYSYSRPVTDLRQYLRVIPPAVHGHQRRGRWQLAVNGVTSATVRTVADPFGNLTLAVNVPRVEETVEFVVNVEADTDAAVGPGLGRGVLAGPGHRVAVDRRGLTPTPLTTPDTAIAELALADRELDVASLCRRVHSALAYEWGVTGVHTTASEALAGGRGVCQDYAHIMLAACRLAGLPGPSHRGGGQPRLGRGPPARPGPIGAPRLDGGGVGPHPQPPHRARLPRRRRWPGLRRRRPAVGHLRGRRRDQHADGRKAARRQTDRPVALGRRGRTALDLHA